MDKVDINKVVRSVESVKPLASEQQREKKLYRVNGKLLTTPEIFWERLSGLYGYPFISQYGEEPTVEWTMALEGLEPKAIQTGLGHMITCGDYVKFPPNPIAFRLLCMPTAEQLGLPSKGEAFYQATNWSRLTRPEKHQSVLLALRYIPDQHAFKKMADKDADRVFTEAWTKVVEHVSFGGKLPEIPLEVEEKAIKAPEDVARSAIDNIKNMME